MTEYDAQAVLRLFPQIGSSPRCEARGNAGGFSGADIWRVVADGVALCLRAWPEEGPTAERLAWIHRVLMHVAAQRAVPLPVPLTTRERQTFATYAGRLWELTLWLPGEAIRERAASRPQCGAALRTLASFHRAAATFDAGCGERLPQVSPGILERLAYLRRLQAGEIERLKQAPLSADWPSLRRLADRWFALFDDVAAGVAARLVAASEWSVPLQPCLRDVRREHFLFTGESVTGLLDFGALQVETVSGDIARLLGSLVPDEVPPWPELLALYETLRPLGPEERALVPIFDLSGQLLTCANWLEWIAVEGRSFADRPQVEARIRESLDRLEHLIDTPSILAADSPIKD